MRVVVFYRLRALIRRKAVEDEMDEELRFHFERQVKNTCRRVWIRRRRPGGLG